MRLTVDQMKAFKLGWGIPDMVDDGTKLVDEAYPSIQSQPISPIN